jgi:hypothetical protein
LKKQKMRPTKRKKQLPSGSSRQEQLMIVSNIRPLSSSIFRMDLKIQESRRETAELCNQPTDYTFPVMMIPVDITRGCSP